MLFLSEQVTPCWGMIIINGIIYPQNPRESFV